MDDALRALTTHELMDTERTRARALLDGCLYPWQAIGQIARAAQELGARLDAREFFSPAPGVWIHKTARVAPSAYIGAPAIIDAGSEVRHCAFIRGAAIVGRDCVVGNSTELKNCILMDGAQVPHFNYVGDSILGWRAHLGASALTANVKGDKSPVTVRAGALSIDTGMRKLGALLGDGCEIGSGAVLNPGTVIGRGARVYPLASVRGFVPAYSICKRADVLEPLRRADE